MMNEINQLWAAYKLAATRLGVANRMVQMSLRHPVPELIAELKVYRDTLNEASSRALADYDAAYKISEAKADGLIDGMDIPPWAGAPS